jgi:hypothetical protein
MSPKTSNDQVCVGLQMARYSIKAVHAHVTHVTYVHVHVTHVTYSPSKVRCITACRFHLGFVTCNVCTMHYLILRQSQVTPQKDLLNLHLGPML